MLCKSLKLPYNVVSRYPSFQSFGLTLRKRSDLEIPFVRSSRYIRVRYTSSHRLIAPFSSFRDANSSEGESLGKKMTNRLATEESPYLLQVSRQLRAFPWVDDWFLWFLGQNCILQMSLPTNGPTCLY